MLRFARLFVGKRPHFRFFSDDRYRRIREWTTSEVATWLEKTQAVITLSPEVLQEGIDGQALISLKREDLKACLAVGPVKAARIESSIRDILKYEAKLQAEEAKLMATKIVSFIDQDGLARRIKIHNKDTFAEMLRNFMACALVDPGERNRSGH